MAAISWWRLNDLPGSSTLADQEGTQALWPDGFGGTLRYAQPGYNEYASLRLLPDGSYPTLYAYLATHALSSAAGTVMLWLRPDAWSEAVTRTIFHLLNTAAQKVAAVVEDDTLKVTINNKFRAVEPISYPDDTWLHLAVAWDGTIGKVYVNGVKWLEDITSVTAMSANVSALYVGTDNTTSNKFAGFLQDAKYYTHALTEAQIQADIAASIASSSVTPYLSAADLADLRAAAKESFPLRGAIQRDEFERWNTVASDVPMALDARSPRSGTDSAGNFVLLPTYAVTVAADADLPSFPWQSVRFIVDGLVLESLNYTPPRADAVDMSFECKQL